MEGLQSGPGTLVFGPLMRIARVLLRNQRYKQMLWHQVSWCWTEQLTVHGPVFIEMITRDHVSNRGFGMMDLFLSFHAHLEIGHGFAFLPLRHDGQSVAGKTGNQARL